MDNSDKITMAQQLAGNDPKATEPLMSAYLKKAKAVILRRLDPLKVANVFEVPEEYEMMQCELAARYFYRMGGEGELAHNENGVNRTYHTTNDEELLREIIPYAKVVR